MKKIQLLVGHEDGELYRLLRFLQIFRGSGAARRFPRVAALVCERDFRELRFSEPEHVALVAPLPERLVFFRCPLQRFSSARASSSVFPRLLRHPSASRTFPSRP